MTTWVPIDRKFHIGWLGLLPEILLADDPRTVIEQLEDRYAHGGGWRPIKGFRMNPDSHVMKFTGDPPYRPVAYADINDERVYFYPACSLLAVVQPDGKFEVTRVD